MPARQRQEPRQSKRHRQDSMAATDSDNPQHDEGDPQEQEIKQCQTRYITTMLPSKQTSTGFLTMRSRRKNKLTTLERHTLSRVIRHSPELTDDIDSQFSTNDIDLLAVEEEDVWESIDKIKSMTIPMTQKKGVKLRILNRRMQQFGSYDQFKWHKRKLTTRLANALKEWGAKIDLWRNDTKLIEGQYGSGVKAYFQFLKWLFYLNVMIFILIFLVVSLPAILVVERTDVPKNNSICQGIYQDGISRAKFRALDLFQGTGFMEKTYIFYGSYPNSYSVGGITYNLPLAYLLVTIAYMLLSLLSIIKTAVKGFRERLVIDEGGRFHKYCHLVLSSWDFCIDNEKSAFMKRKGIYRELQGCLEAERLERERKNKTKNVKKIILIRTLVNTAVLCILAACGYFILYVFKKTSSKSNGKLFAPDNNTKDSNGTLESLIYEFLPSITIVSMNMIVPFIFQYLILFETYSPLLTIRLTLIRTVFLRLASLLVLYVSLYQRITNNDGMLIKECSCEGITEKTDKVLCCETIVGQQIYKLLLTDFASQVFVTFVFNYGRHWLAKNYKSRLTKLIGEQNFDLPRHVLDVVYTQSLCWAGCFYAPLLSALMVVFSFFMFYMKKFACVVNSKPSATIYRVSRSNSMFMVVTFISYGVAVFPVIYSIGLLEPSKSCGPFQHLTTVWHQIDRSAKELHPISYDILKVLYTPAFVVPLFIVLILLLYYYSAVSHANRHMVMVLKKQLVLEGQDKRFLVDRLGQILKQQHVEGDVNLFGY